MEAGPRIATMLPMSTPTVIESPLHLEPVTGDPFIDDLAGLPAETGNRLTASPRRAPAPVHGPTEPLRPRARRRLRIQQHAAAMAA
jgi:hypothetical protein